MLVTATVVLATAAVWVWLGGGPARRVTGGGPRTRTPRAGIPVRPVALALAGVCAAVTAVAVFGTLGGFTVAGVCVALVVRARHARARPDSLPVTPDLPVMISLVSAGIRAGATVHACLSAVARSARGRMGEEIGTVAERMRLGADPAEAWRRSALPEPLVAVGRDLARAADTGAPVADLLDRHVADLRRALRAESVARVERLGVLVVAPLGLCFLPAFVLVGIVPMAAELLSNALGK